VIVVDSDVLT